MNRPDEWFDSEEFEDWAEALEGLMQDRGPQVAHSLLLELSGRLGKGNSTNFLNVATAYRNTITRNNIFVKINIYTVIHKRCIAS